MQPTAITLTQPLLHAALLAWIQAARAGNTRGAAETLALPIEQVADESADFVWNLLTAGSPTTEAPATPARAATTAPPAIGQPWPGQGGTYAGICRGRDGQLDHHLILCPATPDSNLAWQPALDWAAALQHEGHADFHVPTRFESAVLFGNVDDLFDKSEWHWTSTQYSASGAFGQGFNHGGQGINYKKFEARVRAVRRLPINPSILQAEVAL